MLNATGEAIWSPHVVASGGARPLRPVPSLAALQSLLVYGAVLPPLTPWQGLVRGHRPDDYRSVLTVTQEICRDQPSIPTSNQELRKVASESLDRELGRALSTGRRPLVMFSGGVDSALIAARLRELGRDDMVLVHYQFSPHDPETSIALRMAEALGLNMEIVRRDNSGLSLLDEPGCLYPAPFADASSIPTFELCIEMGRIVDPTKFVVFDGIGADGAFGLGRKSLQLRTLSRIPNVVQALGSKAYAFHGWRTRGPAEYGLRVVRRSSRLSPVGAVLAQNSLFDILYHAPDLAALDEGWSSLLHDLALSDLTDQLVVSVLTATEAAIYAQKSLGPLQGQGFEVCYPYLANEMVLLGIRHTTAYPSAEPKAWMKDSLASQVPSELVYRPKQGFIENEMTVFDSESFQAHLSEALSGGVVNELLNLPAIRQMLNSVDRLGALPPGHLNFLWALIFTNRWFETVE